MQNSDLFTTKADSHPVVNGYHDPILLIVTAYASLYRVTKSGRYFLIKTTKDNSGNRLFSIHLLQQQPRRKPDEKIRPTKKILFEWLLSVFLLYLHKILTKHASVCTSR